MIERVEANEEAEATEEAEEAIDETASVRGEGMRV